MRMSKMKSGVIIGALILVFVLIAGIFVKLGNMETNKTLGFASYAVGSLDDSGKYAESELSIYSKKFQKVNGVEITLKEDATISYVLYYYTEDETFISKSDVFTGNYDTSETPETAFYFKVVITPNNVDGEAVKLSSINMIKYLNQIEITVSK